MSLSDTLPQGPPPAPYRTWAEAWARNIAAPIQPAVPVVVYVPVVVSYPFVGTPR